MWRRKRESAPKTPTEDPRAYLLRALGSRDYSRAQLEAKLRERGHAPDRIASALESLIEAGFFKEESFASARIRALLRKGYGPGWIRLKLRTEKVTVDDDMIQSAYGHLGLTEADQVRELVRKQLRSSRIRAQMQADARAARTKLLKSLVAKGHPSALVQRLLDAVAKNEV